MILTEYGSVVVATNLAVYKVNLRSLKPTLEAVPIWLGKAKS